jgi:hypothetical protein
VYWTLECNKVPSWNRTCEVITICITCIMYQQLWGYKVEEKLYLGVREQKKVEYHWRSACLLIVQTNWWMFLACKCLLHCHLQRNFVDLFTFVLSFLEVRSRQRHLMFPLASVSRPALGPTQRPVCWVLGVLSPGLKRVLGVVLTTHPHLVPRSRMSRSYTSSHPCSSMVCCGIAFLLLLQCNDVIYYVVLLRSRR